MKTQEKIKTKILNPFKKAGKKMTNFWDLPKIAVRTGQKDLASRIDEIVYGKK